MFGAKSKQEISQLKQTVSELKQEIEDLRKHYDSQIQINRRQLAGIATGNSPTLHSIMNGLPYSEIPKEEVVSFIKQVSNLLILDVRSDESWASGHIPNAKHIPYNQVSFRLNELADKSRPILTICANGNSALLSAQKLAKEGYQFVYNALGGMAGYKGELIKPEVKATSLEEIKGIDRELIRRVVEVMDRDVRPGLKRDGGDLQILAVEEGVVKVKMVGACHGCGAQKRTVEDGIKTHLMNNIPEIKGIEDWS